MRYSWNIVITLSAVKIQIMPDGRSAEFHDRQVHVLRGSEVHPPVREQELVRDDEDDDDVMKMLGWKTHW